MKKWITTVFLLLPSLGYGYNENLSNQFVTLMKINQARHPVKTAGGSKLVRVAESSGEQPSADAAVEVSDSDNTSSEVVSSQDNSEVSSSAPSTSLRPRPRAKASGTSAAPQKATGIYDMRGCKYGRGGATASLCYKSMSTVARANHIMMAVNYVNSLHGTHFDGRYMLCTGYRESTFNPGALGSSGERGMFQVMKATGRAALRYGVKLQEFDNISSEAYMTQMANSTVAQVELSFLVLKMKLDEDAADSGAGRLRQSRIMGGQGSVDNYRSLAGRYNGGGYNSTYAKKISSCYSCLRGKMSSTDTKLDSSIQTCLNKAK